jgi:hypothetical protein
MRAQFGKPNELLSGTAGASPLLGKMISHRHHGIAMVVLRQMLMILEVS